MTSASKPTDTSILDKLNAWKNIPQQNEMTTCVTGINVATNTTAVIASETNDTYMFRQCIINNIMLQLPAMI